MQSELLLVIKCVYLYLCICVPVPSHTGAFAYLQVCTVLTYQQSSTFMCTFLLYMPVALQLSFISTCVLKCLFAL